MSLWTCIACSARRAVGLDTCPQCGAADHEEGDTISGPEGAQGARHIPQAYATGGFLAHPLVVDETGCDLAAAAPTPTDPPPAPEATKEQP